MTTNMKFLMMLSAGAALLPSVGQETAQAAPKGSFVVVRAAIQDTAPVGGTPMPRLRRTDEEQPGNEMASFWLPPGGKTGLYFAATTELNTGTIAAPVVVRANRRVQGSMTPVTLQLQTDGSVAAAADFTKATFITDLNGQDYRQFNNSTVINLNLGGKDYAWVEYNYQQNGGGNNTRRLGKLFTVDAAGAPVEISVNGKSGPTAVMTVYAKNNDDCSMHKDGAPGSIAKNIAPNVARVLAWRGCNGNGQDDGWGQQFTVTLDSPTTATFKQVGDVSLCPREERSRGAFHVVSDTFAVATWTEGNNQPQRDGVWVAGIDLTKLNGNDARASILWKQQVGGRIDNAGVRTYAMRMKSDLIPGTNQLLMNWCDQRGNNNGNGKGGTCYASKVSLATVDATAGIKFTIKPTDTSQLKGAMDGLDFTHLGSVIGSFGTTTAPVPGMAFMAGNMFGGGAKSDVRVVTFDAATGIFKNAGTLPGAPHDKHLYSNYLGNNPGNQGRNHSAMQIIDNPFLGQANVTATKLLVMATTAKDIGGAGGQPAGMGQELKPEIKLAGWLTIVPVQEQPGAVTPPPGTEPPPGTGSNPDPQPDPQGDSLGGCNAGGTTGFATFLLLGLAAIIRRRR